MTEAEIQRLRDAGISEEVIVDLQKKKDEEKTAGYIDPTTPSETFAQAQTVGKPTQGPEQTWAQTGTEAAVLVPDALKYGGAAAGGYGLYRAGKSLMTPKVAPGPVAPTPAPAPAPAVSTAPQAMGQPLQDFVQQRGAYAPPQQAPAPAQATIAERMKQIAAQRVLPVIPTIARGAGALGGMLYSPSLNTGEAEQLAEYRRRTGQQ